MNARKYPRTTVEAFGTDADSACAIERPLDAGDRVVLWACIAAAVFMGVLFALEYFK